MNNMNYTNTFYQKYKKWQKQQGVISYTDIKEAGFWDKFIEEQKKIKEFDSKKVEIEFTSTTDVFSNAGTKKGKIKVVDDEIRFYEGRKRTRYYRLDSGIYEGFYAVIIPLTININQK